MTVIRSVRSNSVQNQRIQNFSFFYARLRITVLIIILLLLFIFQLFF